MSHIELRFTAQAFGSGQFYKLGAAEDHLGLQPQLVFTGVAQLVE